MRTGAVLDIVKEAILLEKNAESFYRIAAEKAESEKLKTLFIMLAEEEVNHRQLLEETFLSLNESGSAQFPDDPGRLNFSGPVLDDEFRKNLKEAQFDSSAISIALTLEEKAFRFYSEQSMKTDDPDVKKILEWLAHWEQKHHRYFYELDQEMRETLWNDANFWPVY